MATEILMPRQGQSVESCVITEWRVAEGDTVAEGQPVCDIETDKAAFEIEAPVSGTVLGIFYPVDSAVEVLKVIAVIGDPGEDISKPPLVGGNSETTEVREPDDHDIDAPGMIPPEDSNRFPGQTSSQHASPRARSLADKAGIDVSSIKGTGPHGRVIERDVIAAGQTVISPAARAKAFAEGFDIPDKGSSIGRRVLTSDLQPHTGEAGSFCQASMNFPGNSTEVPVKGVRKLVADRMYASLRNSAQLTHHTSADARTVLAYRQKCKAAPEEAGIRDISINDIVLYAVVKTLIEFPDLNAHWKHDKILRFENVHLGLAVDTGRGLMVPVIRYANLMNIKQLSAEARRLATACNMGSVDPDLLFGATFTVSNLGAFGIESFTPVLNAPEVGILGVCSILPKATIKGSEVEFVPHMGLSLTFDHQAVDGAPAARFLTALRAKLAEFERTLNG